VLVIERVWPARQFPKIPFWHGIGIGLFVYAGILKQCWPLPVVRKLAFT
jgi:hypothetical protein